MNIQIEIPTALRRFTAGNRSVECDAADISELLDELGRQFPAIGQHLKSADGKLRQFVNLYVNDEDIRFLGGPAYRFREGDQVLIVPSIAGGAV
jgi:molybdopterin converting factor small subunit